MTKDNSTGKNKEFYDLGKKMFDRIRVLPEHQAMIQRGVDRTTPPFKPDYNTEAVLVEEMQRMGAEIAALHTEIDTLHKILITRAEQIVGLQDEIRNLTGEE